MRKLVSLVLALCMVLTLASFPATAAGENPYRVKIFTMGDSFTQGVIEQNAYRYYIYEPLIKDGAVFEFIGPSSSGDYRVTDLYKKHGGVGGAVIGHSEDVVWNGSSWVTSSWEYTNAETGKIIKYGGTKNSIWYRLFAGSDGTNDYTKTEYGNYVAQADIVTLYIGLNDYYSSGTTGLSADIEHVKQRYYTVVDRIYEINPDVSLYVTDLNEVGGLRGYGKTEAENTDYANSLYKYNEFVLNDVVEHYTEKGYKIQGISLNQEGYKMVSGDTPSDDGHPNHKGNRKIGTQIYMGIKDEVLALNAQGSDVAYNPTRVTGITVDTTSVTLKKGENKTIESTITPSNAEIISVIFSSSNESVATVDGYGRVTAVGEGTATIYATALDSLRPGATERKAACTVTVTADEYEKVGENFLPVFHEKFDAKGPWTGSTDSISESGSVFKHNNVASASITSRKTVDLNTKFSMAFNVAVMGHEMKETNASNRESYYAYLEVGDYQLRVAVNGKSVSFYYDGVLKAEKIFKVPVTRQNDDRYTLVKDGATVCVYRNNELLFTTAVDEYDTATGNVTIATKGYGTINIRDVELKSIRGLVKLDPTAIKYSTATSADGKSYSIENALDGDFTTDYSVFAWKGEAPSAWTTDSRFVVLDLGDYYDVTNLNIYWGHQGGSWGRSVPDAYNVSYSKDNVTYTPALSYSGINSIMVGNSTESYSDIDTSFAITAPSWATGTNAAIYGYGNVKESELDWEGVRYVKIEMTSVTYNPTIAEIEVYATQYMPGEAPNLTATTYTVNYVDTEGNPVAESKTESGYVGYRVTETAAAVDGYLPDEQTKSIVLVDGENTITFVYELIPEKLPLTADSIIAQKGWLWTNDGKIQADASVLFDGEAATNDKGYYAQGYYSSSSQPAANGLYFVIDLGAVVDLSHIVIQGGAPDWNYAHLTNYEIYAAGEDEVFGSSPVATQEHGTTITADNKVRTDTVELKVNDVRYLKIVPLAVYRRPCIGEIEVYRSLEPNPEAPEKKDTTYTVNYVDTEGNPVATAKNGTGKVDDKITEKAVAVDGYTPDKESATITLIDGTNTITFTYTKVEATAAVDIFPIYAFSNYAPQDSVNFIGSVFDGVATADWGRFFRPAKSFAQSAAKGAEANFYVVADLGSPYNLTELYQKWGGNYATKVAVYGSNDQTNWTEIADITRSAQESTDAISHTGYYRYVKVEAYSYTTANSPAILELAFKGTLSPDYEKASLTVNSAPQNKSASTTKENITDGTLTKVFTSSLYNSSITAVNNYNVVLELEKATAIDRLTIFWGNRPEWGHVAPDSYTVYVSADGTNYTPLKDKYTGMLAIATAGEDTTYTDSDTAVFCTSRSETNHRLAVSEYNLNTEEIKFIKVEVNSFKYSFSIAEIEVFAKNEGGTTEPDEPDEPDTPVEPEKKPITLTPAGVSAPTNTEGKPFALATDGDNTTFYAVSGYYGSLSTANYQMIFDIGYLGKVDSLDILWGADSWGNTTPNAYKVEVSSDGKTWTQKKSYSGIYDITTGAAADNISGKDTVFGITTSKWAVDNNDANVNAYTLGNILEKNLGWENVRYIRVTVTSVQYRLAIREVIIGSLPNEDQIVLSKGGQIRVADTDKNISAGLRFGASIIKMNTGIEGEYKYSDDADTRFGMFMLPNDMLDGKTLTAYLANGVQQALDIPAKKVYEQDDNFIVFTAVLTGIPESEYNTEIVAVPYMLKDGEYTYFEEMTKSYVGVAQAARNSTYSDTAIAAVTDETLKAEMQAVADELDKIIEAAKEEIVVRTLPFSRGINVNKMETFLSENTYGAFEEGIEELTNEATYTNIKSQGFDHVRLPVNFYTIYYEATRYGYTTEQLMGYVDTAINLAIKNGLYVTLDFHGWFYIGSEENDYEEFIYCWTQVAERYKDYSDMLSFELLNEPWYTNGQAQQYLSDSRLSQMQVEAINIIRNTGSNNADRLIIICTADGNKAWKISALSAELKACKNIALAIHEYGPYNFTHQNFSWAGLGGKTTTLADAGGLGGANYDFSLIKKFMEETGIPVVLNEFGLNLDKASDEDIDTYIRYITTFCETNNIPWAYWQYSGGYSSEGSMSLYRKTSRYGSQAWDEFALDALFLR